MFEFFTIIFNKAVSAVASVIIAIGLIPVPTPVNQEVNFTPVPEQTQKVIEVNDSDLGNKEKRSQLEKIRLEDEKVKWEAEKAKLEVEAAKAKAEAKRLLQEDQVRKAAEEQRQLELRQQKLLEEQTRQLELQRQQESQRVSEEQKQREQTRVNQINNQIEVVLSEYNEKIAAIDRQILAIEQKYYEDVKRVRNQPVAMPFIDGQIQKLAREADFEINQLQLEQERLRLEYQRRIRELENQL